MQFNDQKASQYISILKEELITAMGCTEPIAIAYAASYARDILGQNPDKVVVEASNNILKNVKSVTVPNTGNLRGVEAAAAAGIVAGKTDRILEVISAVTETEQQNIHQYLNTKDIRVSRLESEHVFDLIVTVYKDQSKASVRVSEYHTNVTRVTKDDKKLLQSQNCDETNSKTHIDRSVLNVKDIIEFSETVDILAVEDLIQNQIDCNSKIAETGLEEEWGANIGKVLMDTWGTDIKIRAKAKAAAGSDARMSGCELPVVIVSGSGNQGITTSVPVIEYARELDTSRDNLIRALLISNLIAIHLKSGIGTLSAYCGAVSAGVAAGAGIAWLHGGKFEEIAHTVVNGLATASGIVCDGAKPSCASKIAMSVENGLLGFFMYKNGQQFYGGDGIVKKGVENTIENIGRLGRYGMRETDNEIISMMLEDEDAKSKD